MESILGDISLFVEVARTKSIKRAAETLGVPNSTLSRRITELEKSLGIRLLHRTTRRIELTEAGQVYYAHCKQIVEAAEIAQQQLKDMTQKPRGRLRLSLPVDFSTLFLAPLIAEFARLYPSIHFDLQLSEHWVDLMQEGVDLSIRLGPQPDSGLTARRIADIHYRLYASPEYLEAHGSPTHPNELVKHSCIRMVCPHWSENWTMLNDGRAVQASIGERIAVNNIALVRRFATLGVGIAPIDVLLAQEDLRAGRLRPVLPHWHFAPVPVFALTPTKLLPAKTRTFIDFLTGRMKAGLLEIVRDRERGDEGFDRQSAVS